MTLTMFPTTALPLQQIAEEMSFSDEAVAASTRAGNAAEVLQIFTEQGYGRDALALIARALPKRFVVVWVCQCVRNNPMPDIEAQMADMAAVALAERWLRQATDEHRRAAADFATNGGYQTLGDWVAATVGWVDGSLAPPDSPPVLPADHLSARAGLAALLILAAREPAKMAERQLAYVRTAQEMFGSL